MGKIKNTNTQKRFKPKFKIKKGDTVTVLSGNDKGTEGRVLDVDRRKDRVLVEGVRIITKHIKPNASAAHPDGGRVKQEAYIHISNVMLVDPKSGQPSRVGRRVEDGKIVRYAKKSGEVID